MEESDLRDRILDTAVELGEERGWNALHLHEIAQALGVPLAIQRHYDRRMRSQPGRFPATPAGGTADPRAGAFRARVASPIFARLDAGATRRPTAAMLRCSSSSTQLQALDSPASAARCNGSARPPGCHR
jgi:AcrR family transcriptional regulator